MLLHRGPGRLVFRRYIRRRRQPSSVFAVLLLVRVVQMSTVVPARPDPAGGRPSQGDPDAQQRDHRAGAVELVPGRRGRTYRHLVQIPGDQVRVGQRQEGLPVVGVPDRRRDRAVRKQ